MTKIISIVGGMQPSAPTIGIATAGDTTASVVFTASSYIGKGTITYTATSSPGGFTATGASSPLTVTGLTNGTAYTFTVVGNTNYGVASVASAASNSITPAASGSYESIATVTVGSGGSSSIDFTSIPSTYKHLQIRGISRDNRALTLNALHMRFNGATGADYSYHTILTSGSGTPTTDGAGGSTLTDYMINTGSSATVNKFSASIIDILDYSTYKNKTVKMFSAVNPPNGRVNFTSAGFFVGDVITSIKLFPSGSANFVEYSTFALYGIKG